MKSTKKLGFKLAAVALAAASVCTVFAGCGAANDTADENKEPVTSEAAVSEATSEAAESEATTDGESDSQYILNKGTLVIGVTDFEPMDYKDKDGNWIGFDADLAKLFADGLGVKPEIVEIDWDNKILELNGKQIDVVWNGMTLTDEVKNSMETTLPYLNNAQVVVVNADKADQIKSVEDLKGMTFAVEAGSAGYEQAVANNIDYTEVQNQAAAVMEAAAGTSDGAIIDSLMAAAMVGEGTSYDTLVVTIPLNSEEYGVGFRKGSDMAERFNEFYLTAREDGSLKALAEKYKVQEALIVD